MLTIEPDANERLWILYAAATYPQWREWWEDERPEAEVRPRGAGSWIAAGTLGSEEVAALARLHERLERSDRYAVIRPVREGEPVPDPAAEAAVAALEPRAAGVFAAAAPILQEWAETLRGGHRPAWFAPMQAALARFMGADVDCVLRVHLLPAGPDENGRTWTTFIGVGHRALECGGPAFGHDGLLEDLLHSAAHAAQPARLDPLVAAYLTTPEGGRLAEQFLATPYAARLRHVPEIASPGIEDLIGEYVVHSLVYQGALRQAGGLPALDEYWRDITEAAYRTLSDPVLGRQPRGLYNTWVLGGCARLQPVARRYLAHGWPLDEAFVRHAFEAFADLYGLWARTAPPEAA